MAQKSLVGRELSRRKFLIATGCGAFTFALSGCGGGGPAGIIPTGPNANGTVTPGVFNGSNLSIASATQASASINSNGAFSTTVSSSGVQQIFLVDGTKTVVGLALSIPGQSITVNAESSLQGLLFLTPGLLTITPSEAIGRLNSLKALLTYKAALAYLQANLAKSSLQAISKDSTFSVLLAACVAEYWNGVEKPLDITQSGSVDGLTVILNQAVPSACTMQLGNASWRFVQVDRLLTNSGGVPIGSPLMIADGLTPMGGYQEFDLGSLFSSGAMPTSIRDLNAIDFTQAVSATYWYQGPGVPNGVAIPSGITVNPSAPYAYSLLYYFFYPLIGILTGSQPDSVKFLNLTNTVFGSWESDSNLGNLISAMIGQSTVDGLTTAVVGLIGSLLGLAGNASGPLLAILLEAGLIATGSSVNLSGAFALTEGVLGAGNATIAAETWIAYGNPDQQVITSSGPGGAINQIKRKHSA